MPNRIIALLLGITLFAGTAAAQTCMTTLYSFSPGSPAVSSQVNMNFTDVVNCINAIASGGTLTGLTLSGTTTLPGSGQITSAGDIVDSGWLGLNGTPNPASLALGQGYINASGYNGAYLAGYGTAFDVGFFNYTNTLAAYVPHGTTNLGVVGSLSANGSLSIGTIATAAGSGYLCDNSGIVSTETSSCGTSASRFKIALGTLTGEQASQGLAALHPVVFAWKDPSHYDGLAHVGLYADEVCKMEPRACIYDADGKIRNYDERAVLAYLVADRAELRSEIEALKACRLWCMIREAFGR